MRRAARSSSSSDIIDNLHWLGITWDEGPQVAGGEDIGPHAPYRQSRRMELIRRARQGDCSQAGSAYRLLVHAGGARGRPQAAGRGEGAAAATTDAA